MKNPIEFPLNSDPKVRCPGQEPWHHGSSGDGGSLPGFDDRIFEVNNHHLGLSENVGLIFPIIAI